MAKPATAQQLADLVQQQQAAEVAALEEQTAKQADGGAGAELAAVLTAAVAAWVVAFGALTAAGTGVKLAHLLAGLRGDVEGKSRMLGVRSQNTLEAALEGASRMGARHATGFLRRASGRDFAVPDIDVSRDVMDAARGLSATVEQQLRLAARLLTPRAVSSSGWRGVVLGLAAARRAVTLARQTIAWVIHRAINDGAAQVADHYGARSLWATEPDACVICLAYAGRLADRDGLFPGGLSMDPHTRSTRKAAIDGPPAHINCRCRLVPWMPDWDSGPGSLPALLRDQALRAAATGRARPSESRAARRRAAQLLLAKRGLPARVRRQAEATAAGRT